MKVYIITMLVSILFSYKACKSMRKTNNLPKAFPPSKRDYRINGKLIIPKWVIWAFFSALPFFLTGALRYNVGVDYTGYKMKHIPAVLNGTGNYIEIAYRIIINISVKVLGNIQWVFVITAGIIVFCFFIYIYKFSENPSLSIYLYLATYVFNQSLNIMRHYIAIAIFFVSIQFLLQRNLVKYFICIGFATLFHRTAIIYFFIYFVATINLKRKYTPVILFLLFFLEPYIIKWVQIICSLLGIYESYAKNMGKGEISYSLFIINVCVYLFATYFVFKDNEDIKGKLMYNLQFITTVITLMLHIIPYGSRFVYMFMPIQIVYIPYLIKRTKALNKHMVTVGFVLLYAAFFYYYVGICNYGMTLPYQWIFNLN